MKKVARLRVAAQNEDGLGAGSTAEQVGVRTTGRIKKPKAVFDPSDNYLPRSHRATLTSTTSTNSATVAQISALERKKDVGATTQASAQRQDNKRLSQSSATSTATATAPSTTPTVVSTPTEATATPPIAADVCVECQKREAKRGTHAKNKLISCLDCERRVHKLCMSVDFEDIDVLRQNYKCENCRTCEVCDEFADCEPKINQPMVTCTKCVKSYHLTCHIPNVYKFQQIYHWKCNKCVPALKNGTNNDLPVKTIREIIGDDPKRSQQPKQQQQQQPKQQQQQQQPKQQQQQQQQQQQNNVNIAAAAEEAKNSAAVKRPHTNDNNKAKKIGNGVGADGTDAISCMDSGGSTGTTSRNGSAGDISANSSSSSSEFMIANTKVDYEPIAKKQRNNNSDEATGNNMHTTHTPVIRYSPYEPIDVPDVKDWNVEQVATYFSKYFPNEANVFREHEIDGTSLLLLKRSDVIKKLPIKLGPSLRIYSLILKIQAQLNDPTLGWNCGL